MFIRRCFSFCFIVPWSFEFILVPKSLMQECYMLFTAVTYQNLMFCHFFCIWCVHLMSMSSTCVLIYAMPSLQRCMPCIFFDLCVATWIHSNKITADKDSKFTKSLKSETLRSLVCMLVLVTTEITKIHGIHPWKDGMAYFKTHVELMPIRCTE